MVALLVFFALSEEVFVGLLVLEVRFQIVDFFRHQSSPQVALVLPVLKFKRIILESVQNLESFDLGPPREEIPVLAVVVPCTFDFVPC